MIYVYLQKIRGGVQMKNFLGKKYVQIGITAFCVIAASLLFYFGIFHTASIARGLNTFFV